MFTKKLVGQYMVGGGCELAIQEMACDHASPIKRVRGEFAVG